MILGVTGRGLARTENPRVGSSILSLATILYQVLTLAAELLRAAMFPCFHFGSAAPMRTRSQAAVNASRPPEKRAQRLPMLNV